jgi:hypothetical protein
MVSACATRSTCRAAALRYKVDLSSRRPWAGIAGANLELSSHWAMQAEYNLGQESNRFVLSLTFRP